MARWQPDAVCLTLAGPFDSLAHQLQQDPDWRLIHAGPVGVVFTPRAGALTDADPATAARILLAGASAPGLTTARAADLTLAAAALFRLAGDRGRAAAALATGAHLRPDHPVLQHNLGNALMAAEDFAAAREHFRAALAVNSRLAGAALNAGVCAVHLGRSDDAIAEFRRAVAIDPELFGAWANLGALLAERGDAEPALEALERALALRPEDSALQTRIDHLRRRPAR